jgi:inorganic triphosphatase YgiF
MSQIEMLEINATTARVNARAAAGDAARQDAKKAKAATAFAKQEESSEPGADQPPQPTPVHDEASGGIQTAAESPPPADSTTRGSEIELKLLVDADRLADFNAAPIIAMNARNKGARKHLKSVYYDTPERTLRRNGIALRVRQTGARFVQTVKAESANDALRRGEWEASVSSMAPDLALAMPFIPIKLRAELARGGLEPVFTADIRRHARIVDLPSGTVEVAFDQGVLTSGDRSTPVSEIELELKGGSASAIYELALRLAEHGPARPSIRSKSARGFDLADNLAPHARPPRKLRLAPTISLDEAFAAILQACLRHLLESLPAAEDGGHPEGVHQMRVSLRRLRSALDLMRSLGPLSRCDALRTEARWLAQNLSAARDWDIFRRETLPTVAKACPSVAGFDRLDQVAEKRRLAAYRKVRSTLTDRRCADFVISLGAWIEARGWRGGDATAENLARLAAPVIDFAGRALSGQHAKVLKRGRGFKSLEAEQLHRLRLAGKKLRYVVDFLLPLYGERKSVKRFARKLAELQHELGCFNDVAVTASLLQGLSDEATESGNAAAVIAGWQAHASISTAPRLRTVWRDFKAMKAPWLAEADR